MTDLTRFELAQLTKIATTLATLSHYHYRTKGVKVAIISKKFATELSEEITNIVNNHIE